MLTNDILEMEISNEDLKKRVAELQETDHQQELETMKQELIK